MPSPRSWRAASARLFWLLSAGALLAAAPVSRGATLGEFTTTDRIDPAYRRPIGSKAVFSARAEEIWATALLLDGAPDTTVGVRILEVGGPSPALVGERTLSGADGSRHVAFNVRDGLDPGRYRAVFLLDGREAGSAGFEVRPAAAGLSAAGGGGPAGGPAATRPAPPQESEPAAPASWIAAVLEFRARAVVNSTEAFEAMASPGALRRLGSVESGLWTITRPEASWSWFLNHAPFTFGASGTDRPICVFYNPFADVALVLEWERKDDTCRIRDLECLPADVLRRKDRPPYDLNNPWDNPTVYPPEGMARRFRDTFLALDEWLPPGSRDPWRTRLGMEPPELAEAIFRPAASLLLGHALLTLDEFRIPLPDEPAAVSALRSAMENIRRQAGAGGMLKILNETPATPEASAAIIRAAGPDAFRNLHIAHVLVGPGAAYVFAVDPLNSDFSLSFAFRTDGSASELVRMDLLHYPGLYQTSKPKDTP